MQKTLKIDDKNITFKCNASFPIVFKNQFGYDILTVIMPLISEILKGLDEVYQNKDDIKPSYVGEVLENITSIEMVDIQRLIWTLAKIENKEIKEPLIWYDSFEEFPIFDIFSELTEIILPSLMSKKKLESLKNLLTEK